MASRKRRDRSKEKQSPKVGSDPAAAREVGGKGDFGAPAGGERTTERDYTSQNTKRSDPGDALPRAYERDGVRDHGAGAPAAGPGSSSGGDLDTDIIGVGTGGSGVSTSGEIHEPPGPDESDGASDVFGAPAPKRPEIIPATGSVPAAPPAQGAAVSPGLRQPEEPTARGADAATNPARGDDSFAGEISSGEARGEDS